MQHDMDLDLPHQEAQQSAHRDQNPLVLLESRPQQTLEFLFGQFLHLGDQQILQVHGFLRISLDMTKRLRQRRHDLFRHGFFHLLVTAGAHREHHQGLGQPGLFVQGALHLALNQREQTVR